MKLNAREPTVSLAVAILGSTFTILAFAFALAVVNYDSESRGKSASVAALTLVTVVLIVAVFLPCALIVGLMNRSLRRQHLRIMTEIPNSLCVSYAQLRGNSKVRWRVRREDMEVLALTTQGVVYVDRTQLRFFIIDQLTWREIESVTFLPKFQYFSPITFELADGRKYQWLIRDNCQEVYEVLMSVSRSDTRDDANG